MQARLEKIFMQRFCRSTREIYWVLVDWAELFPDAKDLKDEIVPLGMHGGARKKTHTNQTTLN